MKRETVITIKDLKIDYRNLQHFTIQQMIKNPALKGGNILHAIRGINLEVHEGEVLGIVGANGAGKSTLLKAIAGIFQPDEGSIDTCGKRVSLMSLGVGFKWDLSGRDNIMLAGLLLRYPASYIKEKIPEIISFAELENEIDRPVRTYSDGMYSKLSFAITAILDTDIMLVDELLSVGDEKFQRKSFAKIRGLVEQEKMTSVIVSHDMDLINEICDRVVWMHKGKIVASGDPAEIVSMYMRWSRITSVESLPLHDHLQESFYLSEEDRWSLQRIALFRGITVDDESGILKRIPEDGLTKPLSAAVNWEPVFLRKGTVVRCQKERIQTRLYIYSPQIPPELIYVSAVSTEGNATSFTGQIVPLSGQGEWICPEDCYVRFLFLDLETALPADLFLDELADISGDKKEEPLPPFLDEEIEDTVETFHRIKEPEDCSLLLLADSHVCAGGNWRETAFAIRTVAKGVHPDAVIHLGDLTDGTMPGIVNYRMVQKSLNDLKGTGAPVYLCPGNHDLDSLPAEYWMQLEAVSRYADNNEHKLRMIFLSSYDPLREDAYGYSEKELKWTEDILNSTPADYGILVFSHISPLRKQTKYNENVLNSTMLMEILERFDRRTDQILGVFYGHEHEDQIDENRSFPVIGIACSKLENCKEESPLYSKEFSRVQGEASQELFDLVIVKKTEKRMELIRFGAGENRQVKK